MRIKFGKWTSPLVQVLEIKRKKVALILGLLQYRKKKGSKEKTDGLFSNIKKKRINGLVHYRKKRRKESKCWAFCSALQRD
jgi:hypothetical protein